LTTQHIKRVELPQGTWIASQIGAMTQMQHDRGANGNMAASDMAWPRYRFIKNLVSENWVSHNANPVWNRDCSSDYHYIASLADLQIRKEWKFFLVFQD